MREPVNKEHNTANLRDISAMMQDIEHFIFFGTLLGYEREKGIIEGDDDIDIYVNSSERAKLIRLLQAELPPEIRTLT